jgi:SAM-dependent methyltransferase
MYDHHYFTRTVEDAARHSAPFIADSIITEFRPYYVIDVGCGTGALLEVLQARGCSVMGLENAQAAIELCRARNVPVLKFDLEQDKPPVGLSGDVVISLEVAEHLPERSADRFVDLLTKLSKQIVFTAAYPGQGGGDHVNEQPQSYWIEKFRTRGFDFDEVLSLKWRQDWKQHGLADWYWTNCMVFRKS